MDMVFMAVPRAALPKVNSDFSATTAMIFDGGVPKMEAPHAIRELP
jgi:hypothetical protein